MLDLVQRTETTKDPTSAILIDIQGAFDNVNSNLLVDTMEEMKLPKAMIKWTYEFISQRKASLLMDQYKGPIKEISTGVPQGSPISPLLFMIYTTPMYSAIKEWGGTPSGFIDDVTITVQGKIEENTQKLSDILKKCCEWATSRMTKIDLGDKLGFIHFTKKNYSKHENAQLVLPTGERREPQSEVKLLGITLDHKLDLKKHILNKVNKGRQAIGAIWRLGGTLHGMRGVAVRSLYVACVRPIVEYGIEVWHHKILKDEVHKLDVMQNMALRRIMGAYRTTPINVLQKEAGIMPYGIRIDFMARRKAARLYHNLSETNPVGKHLVQHVTESPLGKLTMMYNQVANLKDQLERIDPVSEQHLPKSNASLHESAVIASRKRALDEWQAQYLQERLKGKWYHNITADTKCIDKITKMKNGEIMKKFNRRIVSTITQYRTNHGNFGAWFKRFRIEKESYNCKCGELETVKHILVDCPLLETIRVGLRRVSPEMDMPTLLNSLTGLQEIASFISVRRD